MLGVVILEKDYQQKRKISREGQPQKNACNQERKITEISYAFVQGYIGQFYQERGLHRSYEGPNSPQ